MTPNEIDLDTESVICMSPDKRHEVRVPAFPEPCDYIRIVFWKNGSECFECVYWSRDEIRDDDFDEPLPEAFGAAMAAIKMVFEGNYSTK